MDKEKEWQDLDRYQDVFGQLPMLQAYSHIILTFPMPENVSREEIIHDLETAMERIRRKLPWMGAQIINVGKEPGNSGVNKYAPCSLPKHTIVAKDVSSEFPTYAEVKRLKAPIGMLDSALLSPCSSFPQPFQGSEEDPAQTTRLQVSFINGGVFLNFVIHHATCDAGGHFWLARLVAMSLRGEEFPESFLEEANRDRRTLFPLLGPDEPMLDHSHLKRPPITADNPIVAPTTTTWHFFRLTAAKMAALKNLASQKDGYEPDVPYITTDDAISAFCWQRFIAVRESRLDPNTMAKFSRTIDGRKSLGISSNYLGDVIHNVQTVVSVKDLIEKPLANIASRMRKRLNEVTNSYHIRSFASFIMSQPDKSTITYGGRVNTETDIGSSSVRAAELYFDFGKLGRPDFVRRPCLKGVSCPGLLAFLPQNPDGDCDFVAALTEEDVAMLKADPVWTQRKKTRCPGERPACSTCARLYQVCRYGDEATQAHPIERENGGNLEGRLAQLEQKMEMMLERAIPEPPSQKEPPHSSPSGPTNTSQTVPAASVHRLPPSAVSEPLPPKDVMLELIGLYFQYCHRQPLWFFERQELSSLDTLPEEVTFSLLALAIRFSTREGLANQAQDLSQKYAEVARGHIMFRITQGAVQLSTIQSLCLLAFANFVAQDTHLAWLNINLANSLSMAADLSLETNSASSSPAREAKRKVFYSLHVLNELYAPRSMMLNMLDDIENPRYMEPKRDPARELGRPPPLTPRDSFNITQPEREGIWTYMVQQTSLWREVRGYIAQCADGNPKPPWSPESGYAMIGAHLMEVETRFPTYHRYDAVKFLDRPNEELQKDRDYWSPWLVLQFGYHAIHSMLNHPFLYSSRPHQFVQMSVPNTFWKTSSELALLHSTWTARLIDMVWEKDYRVSDPFIGYCAAIAATIHIYYCRAADIRVRTSAQNKLSKCMRFVDELGTVWPVCQWIYDRLDTLVQSAFKTNRQTEASDSNRRTVSINISLMWDILDFTSATKPSQKPGRGLFDPSFIEDSAGKTERNNGDEDEDEHTVETQIFHRPNPAADIDTSNGGQELPPFSDAAARRKEGRGTRGRMGYSAPADERSALQQHQHGEFPVPSWSAAEVLGNTAVMDISYDPFFQFQDHDSQYTGFWEIGNL